MMCCGRFEIVAPARFGLVCFRLKASCAANEELRQACLRVDRWMTYHIIFFL